MVYKNSNEVMQLSGVPIYMQDIVSACLKGKLNLFLQGDTGSGKTQLAADAMSYFPNESLFVLGRNDMDTRELFQQFNLDKLKTAKSSSELKTVSDKIDTKLIVVDEMPNCVPAVRAQLFNLFDGYIELDGKKYNIGNGYSVGIATGNIGQRFTESSNELGRALKDRMHVILDVDYFRPTASDTLEILANDTNPRVEFSNGSSESEKIIQASKELEKKEIPFDKLIIANYLIHGLDYCTVDGNPASKTKLKEEWPNCLENHSAGSDESLVLPVSVRAAKSIIRLSQALDEIVASQNGNVDNTQSMLQAYKLVSAYSGVLNEAEVKAKYQGDKYAAMDAIIASTNTQLQQKQADLAAGFDMINSGKLDQKVLDLFCGRWNFMKSILESFVKK
ncbi:MAG: AAA family ATPase [Candidatus Nanoarchaeia archaeon]|nr:AAA family ATPase [Candidatus Nanoarchaeia archaeon]